MLLFFEATTMKKSKIIISILWLAATGLSVSTFAAQNPTIENSNIQKAIPQTTTQNVQPISIDKIYETKDYEAFKRYYAGDAILNKINTKEKFYKYADMKIAYAKWDIQKALELERQLWLTEIQEAQKAAKAVEAQKKTTTQKKTIKKTSTQPNNQTSNPAPKETVQNNPQR